MLNIGIDIDNCITENSIFFSMLTNSMKGNCIFHIITNRDPLTSEEIVKELKDLGIHFDKLIITADKSEYILESNITVYFDDTDEYFLDLPESVTVFKIREPGNFCYDKHKWIYGNRTGINIDK
jgi:hypothetical protein